MNFSSVVSRGVRFVNVTPHPIRLQWEDGLDFVVFPSGVLVNATPESEPVGRHPSGVALVRVRFSACEAEEAKLAEITAAHPEAVVMGSVITAQAFPGRVLAMIPAPGFERAPTEEKRMRADEFTTYGS